jgi:hypothetical protein
VSGKMEASKEHMLNEHKTIKKMDSTVLRQWPITTKNVGLKLELGC